MTKRAISITAQLAGWGLYTLFWALVSSPRPLQPLSLATSSVFTLFNAAAVYVLLLVLVPGLLRPRRYWQFGLGLALLLALDAALLAAALYGWFSLVEPALLEVFFYPGNLAMKAAIGSTLSVTFPALGVYLIFEWIQVEKHNRQLREEKLRAELDVLKNQLNPHFLFNALNSIYFLIKKDPEAAAEALAGFSNLLRYQLYLADAERIPLQQELDYLEQYIKLARLRLPAGLNLRISLPRQLNGEQIPPLLLLPLVENAFKHVARKNGEICIEASVNGEELRFFTRNNTEPRRRQEGETGGLGLQNARRRLKLAYPQKHALDVRNEDSWFEVHLKLNLS